MLEYLFEALGEMVVPVVAGAFTGLAALFAGYAVYKVTVAILDRFSLKEAVKKVLGNIRENAQNKVFKAIIKEIQDKNSISVVKIDVLDQLNAAKVCEAEIQCEKVCNLHQGDVIEDISFA